MEADPIHQFHINGLIPIHIGGLDFSFTNAALFMVVTVIASCGFLYLTTSSRGIVPGRMQSISEMTYEFVAQMLRDSAGAQGMHFFPFVFAIFMFVLFGNLFGLFPYFFTTTSQLIVTASLALLVFFTVIISGLRRHGLHFLGLFVPSGVPKAILPLIVVIEFLSFLSRPISHSVRLFANMLGGHITLKVFAGFATMLVAAGGAFSVGAAVPVIVNVGLYGLELLMALLQAYVFAILTCIYLNDALHPSH